MKVFNVKVLDYEIEVYVSKLIVGRLAGQYLVAIPSVKWSYNVGSWSTDAKYWQSKLPDREDMDPVAEKLAKLKV